jgi:hypothetical protein
MEKAGQGEEVAMDERLIHDAAFATGVFLLEYYAPCTCEEERRKAFDLTYRTIRGAIEAYRLPRSAQDGGAWGAGTAARRPQTGHGTRPMPLGREAARTEEG